MAVPAQLLGNRSGAARWRSRIAARPNASGSSARSAHWNVMSRHFEMSEPRPEEMVMQPRTFCAVTSAAQIE
ncbi:hypothetical protein SAMN04487925_103449 [Bradyrhizobium sp. cf659]|nr:hypothetical protein SAMN04487925_103449 [Bradyrhizobium sp. cf659]